MEIEYAFIDSAEGGTGSSKAPLGFARNADFVPALGCAITPLALFSSLALFCLHLFENNTRGRSTKAICHGQQVRWMNRVEAEKRTNFVVRSLARPP